MGQNSLLPRHFLQGGIAIACDATWQRALEVRGGDESRERLIGQVIGSQGGPEIDQLPSAVRSLPNALPAQAQVHGEVRVEFDVVLGKAVQVTYVESPGCVAAQVVGHKKTAQV